MEIPTRAERGAYIRRGFCDKDPNCEATCGKCRVRWYRIRRLAAAVTDEDFTRAMEAARAGEIAPTEAGIARYVHETLRRRNEPWQGDTKLTVRLHPDDLQHMKDRAAEAGLSLQKYALYAVLIAAPADVADAAEVLADGGRLWTADGRAIRIVKAA